MALIAAGYVLGARAGHERYEQIVAGIGAASQRLEAFSARRPPAPLDSSHPIDGSASPPERPPR